MSFGAHLFCLWRSGAHSFEIIPWSVIKGSSTNFAVIWLELCFLKIRDDHRQQEVKSQQERTYNTNDFCKYCFFTLIFLFKSVDYLLLSYSYPFVCMLRNTFYWRTDWAHASCIRTMLYSEICLAKISKLVKILTFEMQTWPGQMKIHEQLYGWECCYAFSKKLVTS